MSVRIAWVAASACALVAGCASMRPPVATQARQLDCDAGKACTVVVDVSCTRFHGCRLAVDYDLVLVKGRGRNVDITWQLSGEPGAEFAANGVVLDNAQFECKPKAEKRQFGCSDKHSDFGVFKYSINVTLPGSAFGPRGVPSLDPWIVND